MCDAQRLAEQYGLWWSPGMGLAEVMRRGAAVRAEDERQGAWLNRRAERIMHDRCNGAIYREDSDR